MNTLTHMSLADAAEAIRAGRTIPDGTEIVAHYAAVESHRNADVATVASAHGNDWRVRHGDGSYTYRLLVARSGVEVVRDAKGDECGVRVVGTRCAHIA